MKTNQKVLVRLILTATLPGGMISAYAQNVTIQNNGKTTSIKTDGSNVSVSTDERSGASRRTRITTKSSPGSRGGNITLVQNHQQLTYDLNDESLTISGNDNTIVVRGKCRQLTVSGNRNVVHLESVGAIGTPGNRNQVAWRNGDPSVSNTGGDNVVGRE